ncbi:flagellar FliJ family protein [Microbacterium sp.]|uniref:flagellar FliJ family protein n=1 Tax=Microbacterium sp. TaxID=51671 RepID=UPI00273744E3|nr:flagellar FliJ family protein [Microbacterium sp.]MDP3953075.1 flagellar FliJ family protein [Microbacterium sp.]
MTRGFSLAGLLRVREIQERAAAQRLSRAVIDAHHIEVRDRHLRSALAGEGTDAVDVRSLAALAAARSAGRSMLAELTALAEVQSQSVDEARTEHADARRAMRGLDRLADAHAVRERTDELRIEQAELDEIASRSRTEGDR